MLSLHDVTLRRGSRVLFEHGELAIHAGQKIGVTGANGAGKSSLLALLRGELEADVGEMFVPPGLAIAHVAQETPAVTGPAVEFVMAGDRELTGIQAELAKCRESGDGMGEAAAHGRLEAIDGYSARSRAGQLMHGLGFSPVDETRPVGEFSGGWRMRLNLAQALMCRSDLLMLDEPTNHLDLDAVIWLEDWLQSYPGTLLLISHDRDFLDRVIRHVVHIEHGGVRLYAGNYSDFELQRVEALAAEQAALRKQQQEIAHVKRFVDRFRAKATKARQAQSRLKALARMEIIAPAHVNTPFRFAFSPPDNVPHPLLCLEDATAGYSNAMVLSDLNLTLAPGDRCGLLGPNGAGKSTLVKLLAGAGDQPAGGAPALVSGQRDASPHLAVGYFAQHQVDQLHFDATPMDEVRRLEPDAPLQSLRDFLGGFGFTGERVFEPVARLSGGEKARLVLALIVHRRPNLLLLDEPTNHLDLEMRHALGMALQDFRGALVVVSHDRHLLRTVCDELLLVHGGAVAPFDGDLDDYRRWLMERRRAERENNRATTGDTSRRLQRRREAAERQRLQPLRQELQRLEQALDRLQSQKARLEQRLAEPAIYEASEKTRLKELLLEQARVDRELSTMEEAWLAAGEELEAAQAE